LFSATAAVESTDDSNSNLHLDESQANIIPLSPSEINVRYLGPKPDDAPQYTLVLDLDETLIHCRDTSAVARSENDCLSEEKQRKVLEDSPSPSRLVTEEDEELTFYIRPGLNNFLSELSKHYELVLFTAATREYADYFLRQIDPKNLFKNNILTREHCKF